MSFKARFPGKCRTCDKAINPGDDIIRLGKSNHVHLACADAEVLKADIAKEMEWKAKNMERKAAEEAVGNWEKEHGKPSEDPNWMGDLPG